MIIQRKLYIKNFYRKIMVQVIITINNFQFLKVVLCDLKNNNFWIINCAII